MSMQSIIVVIVLALLFAGAVVWISKNGGWTDESQCLGNCSTCDKHCTDPKKKTSESEATHNADGESAAEAATNTDEDSHGEH